MYAESFKEIQGISCSSLDLKAVEPQQQSHFSPSGLFTFSHFIFSLSRGDLKCEEMSPCMTDECVRVYIIRLLLPICPRFCHIFLLYEHQQKNWSPHTAWLHPTSVTGKGHFLHKLSTVEI